MQVIPVIDLMRGLVVRGMGGQRDQYRPIESMLTDDPRPESVARALATNGFRPTYVADLDAIEQGDATHAWQPAWSTYEALIRAGLDPWIDAGLTNAEQARRIGDFEVDGRGISGVVAGLESLCGPQSLADMCALLGTERLIFSLDLKAGIPLIGAPAWKGLSALQIAAIALRVGVRRMIVLDLAAVGMGLGAGTQSLCRDLRSIDSQLQIIAGGGVRGPEDLCSLAKAGCDAALVASALHDGRLDARECARATR